jgi:DNA replication protein DnaC
MAQDVEDIPGAVTERNGVKYVNYDLASDRHGAQARTLPVMEDLASFDFEAQPSVDPRQVRDLAAGRWIGNGENLLLLGPPGV